MKSNLLYTLIGIFACFGIGMSSCTFLDPDRYFEDFFPEDSIFHSKSNAEGYLWNTPTHFPDPSAIWGGSWNPGELASDEMTVLWETAEFPGISFTKGTITERNLPSSFLSTWYQMYTIIRRCNLMIANIDKVQDMNTRERQEYLGYVHFMRGYAYYHLLQNFGPCLILGDEVIPNNLPSEDYDRERATYDESVDYIVKEFEEASRFMPSPVSQSSVLYARPTKGAALALIARLRLYQASPLFNGGDAARRVFGDWTRASDGAHYVNQTYDPNRWAIAAAAAKQVINMGYYELHTVDFDAQEPNPWPIPENVSKEPFPMGAGGIDPYRSYSDMFTGESLVQNNKEFIWAQPSGQVSGYTRHSFPVYYGGWGGMSVPQRVVDAYLMMDGKTIDTASQEYPYDSDVTQTMGQAKEMGPVTLKADVPKMYNNREVRFYASIGFPGRYWKMNSASDGAYMNKQFWFSNDDNSGKTGAGNNVNDYTISGYVPTKYIHDDDSWANGKGQVKGAFVVPKSFPIIRYAEVLLEYIEALNNVEGTYTASVMSADGERVETPITRDVNEMKKYFNMIRYRVGLPGPDDALYSDPEEMRKVIMNERQIELFNEGYRYFDTRRWGTYLTDDANPSNWFGLNTKKDRQQSSANTGFWELVPIDSKNIRDRIATPKQVLLPLPHNELMKTPKMAQNPGYER
ncbi:MAG: RagB/SusD family nutrient uptake outer membrane protein [Porphyromonas sp.]|nr:RagB/SusD family nutrient uptake outer membrane protein [Bacteroidales bacterium]MDD7559700.1 RagB/SusD family nutrient uptake outer membrane protein [Bacteroidales bacterium]MDY3100184.1 RagB/SusD family nutrient uptake outer membrane protein [Porphyromonas sp.]